LKKAVFAVALLSFVMIVLVSFSVKTAQAQSDYGIDHVSHSIEVMYNGYISVNDTIKLNKLDQAPNDFLIGFPYKYGSYVLECTAFNASNDFQVKLDESLENHVGFYAVKISFPQGGAPQEFTVGFVLSNSLLQQDSSNASLYTVDFPAYPGLTKTTTICNASLVLPPDVAYVGGTVAGPTYGTENLQAFSYSPASVTISVAGDRIQLVNVDQLKREIKVNEFGELECSDAYVITNMADSALSAFEFILPPNATEPSAEDQFGRTMTAPTQTDASLNRYKVNLTLAVYPSRSTRFTVKYILPKNLLTQEGTNSFALTFPSFQNVNYYISQASVTFTLPEGARVLNPPSGLANGVVGISKNVFQETATISMQGVTHSDKIETEVEYWYDPLWLSFRPTMWIWALSIVGCVVMLVWRRPKTPVTVVGPSAALKIRPEFLKSFVDSYEERMKIGMDLESIETGVQKGRIPRRRYKVRRKMLETRLGALSRSLEELRDKMRGSGGHYVDLMRQLEVAETEISEVETNVKSIEARHNRGELSLEAYRKLLGDYERKKQNAETTINGILIRLREEIR
jgi:hypothetical protein